MTIDSNVQRTRAAQAGLLMRTYRETFSEDGGRRGLTQEELLRRMALVDTNYAVRYSHATVSRWESGGTRPTIQRLQVFGKALNLLPTDVAGLVLLAGLTPDFVSALECVDSQDVALDAAQNATQVSGSEARKDSKPGPEAAVGTTDSVNHALSPSVWGAVRFTLLRLVLVGACIVGGGYALSLFDWNYAWASLVYVGLVTSLVLAQQFLLPNRSADLGGLFWVSIFFLLTTPLLQFSPLRMDHYNFYTIASFAGTPMPYMLSLLVNLALASTAGLLFRLIWIWQCRREYGGSDALRRAVWVTLPPVAIVYAVVVVISNASIWIQFAVLMPVIAAIFTMLLVLQDPKNSPSESDRRFLLSTIVAVAIVSTTLGIITILAIYVSPDLPMVLPDHNLLRSWEINFTELGYSREEALHRLNLGYLWHAMFLFAYMFFVVGANLIVAFYRIGQRGDPSPTKVPSDSTHQATQEETNLLPELG